MQKTIDSIDESSKKEILNRWVTIRYEKGVDYTLIWQILLAALLILFGFIFWNRKLAHLNTKLQYAKDKAEEATKAKSNFIANVSHEIRTPMNAIVGMTYLIKQTSLSEVQHNHLKKIENASQNLLNLINDILDFSKIEASKLTLDKIDFNLIELLNSIENIISVKAYEKGLLLKITYDKSDAMLLHGDKLRLSQVLTNLLSNAVKFTEKGSIELTVKQTSDERFRFSILDSGIGLSQEQMKKLFLAFTQADGSTTRKYGGTGLGLTISKELVELMDGEIWVESELGIGSEFIFEVSLQASVEENKSLKKAKTSTVLKGKDTRPQLSPKECDKLFTELYNGVTKRRPHLCTPILEQLESYRLEPEKEKLLSQLSTLIKHYKFQEAKELFNG